MENIRTKSGISQNEDSEIAIIKLLRKDKQGLQSKELEKLTEGNISRDTLYRKLKKLTRNGTITHTQNGKTVIYQLTSQRLVIKMGYAGIMKRGKDISKPDSSDVKIVLTISNPTKDEIGISQIIVDSQKKDFLIPIRMRDWDTGETFSHFNLKPQETKNVILFAEGLPVVKNIDSIPVMVKIYDAFHKIIRKLELKLSNTGSLAGLD